MARLVDPVTGGVTYETRGDLFREFDQEVPRNFKWGFELPQNVDFYVVLSEHTTPEDFVPVDALLSAHPDLYLTEGISSNDRLSGLLNILETDGMESLDFCIDMIGGPNKMMSVNSASYVISLFRSIAVNRVKVAVLDPPPEHRIAQDVVKVAKMFDDDSVTAQHVLGLLSKLSTARDTWALNNLRKIVDKKVPYCPEQRRSVVISRGFLHLGLLRALEYKCALDDKAGSIVVSSQAIIPAAWSEEHEKEITLRI